MTDFAALPVDPLSHADLTARGLQLALLDTSDAEATKQWLLADARGFYDAAPSEASLRAQSDDIATDRVTGVWDSTLANAETPVATVRCWHTDLTVPGGSTLPAWAISAVTVAPTHRRRGIARAMLTAELRTAIRLGLSMAALTVSEATIYGRYGFGPAAYQAFHTIDTRRALWTGSAPAGRVQFISAESLRADGPAIFERARRRSPGDITRRPGWWTRILGLEPGDEDARKRGIRIVRYDDDTGTAQGFAVYDGVLLGDSLPGRLNLVDLVAATDDAYAALWRYVLELDLVDTVTAPLRSVSEPLLWQVADRRAVRKTEERDHLWLRILDVPQALAERTYSAAGEFVLEVTDDLGFTTGDYLLTVAADGTAHAHALALAPESPALAPASAARLRLSIADLAAIYLGGSNAVELARAGRIEERTADAAARLGAAFHWPDAPRLSIWF